MNFRSLHGMEFPAEMEELDLSGNALKSVPSQLSKFQNLRSINLSQNPIQSLGEFTFDGDSEKFVNLENVTLEDCDQLGYVDDAAFAYLKNLKSVSFKNSALFYLRNGLINFFTTLTYNPKVCSML